MCVASIAATPTLALLALLSFAQCGEESSSGGGPVLTRISEPIPHGEGPHWDNVTGVLYYVDISGQTVHRHDPSDHTETTLTLDKPVSLVVPIKDNRHKFVISRGLDLDVLTWDWETGFYSISPLVSVDSHSPTNRFNDGKADSKGRIWAGTMGEEKPVGTVAMLRGSLYRVDNDPSVPCRADSMLTPVSISNGLAWSADDTVMYYADTPTRRVDAFDFNIYSGNISNGRPVFEFGDVAGNPDGITIDSNGHLWIACWGGSQVIQVDPANGRLLRQIRLPVERVTSVAFGGPALATLYITTMRLGLSPEQLEDQPHAGALFQVTGLGVTGTPSKPAVVNCKCNKDK